MPTRFFQRFRWSDANALARELDEAATAHRAAQAAGDAANEIECACRLAVALTAADREAEAVALLEAALPKARALAQPASVAWVLLYLGTARQYLGNREQAHTMFAESLEITGRGQRSPDGVHPGREGVDRFLPRVSARVD